MLTADLHDATPEIVGFGAGEGAEETARKGYGDEEEIGDSAAPPFLGEEGTIGGLEEGRGFGDETDDIGSNDEGAALPSIIALTESSLSAGNPRSFLRLFWSIFSSRQGDKRLLSRRERGPFRCSAAAWIAE